MSTLSPQLLATDPFDRLAGQQASLERTTAYLLRSGGTQGVASIASGHMSANSVTAGAIAAGSVTANAIDAGAVTADAINAGAVTTDKLAAGAVTADKIQVGTINATLIAANTITALQIATGAITTDELAAGAVTAAKIAADSITTSQLAANSVTTSELAADSVTSAKIAAGTIVAGDIAAGTITATQIATGTITATQIAAGTITGDRLVADTITGAQIAGGTITGGEIASGTVTASHITIASLSALSANLGTITAGTVTGATLQTASTGKRVVMNTAGLQAYDAGGVAVLNFDVATGNLSVKGAIQGGSTVPATTVTGTLTDAQIAALAASKITGTLTDAQLAGIAAAKVTGQITTTQITDLAISTPKLAAGAVTAAKITADTITANEIAALAIGTAELAAGAVTAAKITAGTITATQMAAGTITANELATDSVTSAKIAAGTIVAGDIASATITGANIAANTIAAGNIAAATITATQIAGATITGAKIAANTITAGNVAAGTLTATQIQAGSITADRLAITTLSAITADLGVVTAGTLTGTTIRTAASGARVQLDANGLFVYSSTGGIDTQQIAFPTTGGANVFGGAVNATGGIKLASTLTSPSPTGNQIQFTTPTGSTSLYGTLAGFLGQATDGALRVEATRGQTYQEAMAAIASLKDYWRFDTWTPGAPDTTPNSVVGGLLLSNQFLGYGDDYGTEFLRPGLINPSTQSYIASPNPTPASAPAGDLYGKGNALTSAGTSWTPTTKMTLGAWVNVPGYRSPHGTVTPNFNVVGRHFTSTVNGAVQNGQAVTALRIDRITGAVRLTAVIVNGGAVYESLDYSFGYTLPANTTKFLAVTIDTTTQQAKLYVDGVQAGATVSLNSSGFNTVLNATGQANVIGDRLNGHPVTVDEAFMCNDVVPAATLLNLYNLATTGVGAASTTYRRTLLDTDGGSDFAASQPVLQRGLPAAGTESATIAPGGTGADVYQQGSSGALMQITFTPTKSGYYEIGGSTLVRGIDAAWTYTGMQLSCSPSTADAVNPPVQVYNNVHNSLQWVSFIGSGWAQLTAGVTYTIKMRLFTYGGGVNVRYYTRPDVHQIWVRP